MKRKYFFAFNSITSRTSASRSASITAGIASSLVFSINLAYSQPRETITSSKTLVVPTGKKIDGGGNGGFLVKSGIFTASDVTLTNFRTAGGNGSGGGAGLGGAIFVNSGASAVLNNVSFLSNSAVGGSANGSTYGGTMNNLSLGTQGGPGASGYTPALEETTDIEGTTGTAGKNAAFNTAGVGGTGGAGGAGGNAGNSNPMLDRAAIALAADLVALGVEAAGSSQPFTASILPGIIAQGVVVGLQIEALVTETTAWNTSLREGQIGLGGDGATGGLGGGAGDFYGGGLGGGGGNGGKGASIGGLFSGGAAGGSGGDGGDGGFGGFGSGGGKGGNGGEGGKGASVTATSGSPAKAAVYTTIKTPEVHRAVYIDPSDGTKKTRKEQDNFFDALTYTGTGIYDHDNDASTPKVDVIYEFSPSKDLQMIKTPAVAAVSAFGGGSRADGATGAGGAGGVGGFGAGEGATGNGKAAKASGGDGGNGYGGSIFVRDGGTLTIKGNTVFGGSRVSGGLGQAGDSDTLRGDSGKGVGNDIFMMKGSTVVLDAGVDNVITFNAGKGSSIADDSTSSIDSSAIPSGEGAGITVKSGLIRFLGENSYSGETKIEGGVLRAQDGEGVNTESRINLAGGVIQSNGDFKRYVGNNSDQIKWTNSGGFAAFGGDLTVSLNYGLSPDLAKLTWASGSFVGNSHALLFGSETDDSKVTFTNNIDLNDTNTNVERTIKVMANAKNTNHATISGVISGKKADLVVGDSTHKGTLILTGANTYDGKTTIKGGTLDLQETAKTSNVVIEKGATLLNRKGGLEDTADAKIDGTMEIFADESMKSLTGSGSVKTGEKDKKKDFTVASGNFGGVISGDGAFTKNTTSSLTLGGANTYTGNTSISAGELVLDGSLASEVVTVSKDATLKNAAGGLADKTKLTNNGTINQNADDTVDSLINTGKIDGTKTLTAKTYDLKGGSDIIANLGAGDATANGKVALKGTSAAGTFKVETGTTTLGSSERLADDTELTINKDAKLELGGKERIGTLLGAGVLDNKGSNLSADKGDFSGIITGSGELEKYTSGELKLTGANTFTGKTTVKVGTLNLTDKGAIGGNVEVDKGATLTNASSGLVDSVTLTNNGTVNQDSDDTIVEFINTGKLDGTKTLTATTYTLNNGSEINANLGTGTVNASDTVSLNGTSAASNFNVKSGVTTLSSTERLLDTTDLDISSNAKLVLGGAEKIGSLTGAGSIDNKGFKLSLDDGNFSGIISGSGQLGKGTSGLLTLTGSNTYTGTTYVDAGTLKLARKEDVSNKINAPVKNTSNGGAIAGDVVVAKDAFFTNETGGLLNTATLTNDGTVNQDSDDTVKEFISTGKLDGTKTLTATTYTLNNGSVINANLGTGTVNASDTVTLNGTSGASKFNVKTGTTTLGSAERLLDTVDLDISDKATLNLGGKEMIGSLTGAGALDNLGYLLSLDDGDFSGIVSGTGGLTKLTVGELKLSGANTYSGATSLDAGSIVLDGSLTSNDVTVAKDATLTNNKSGLADDTKLTVNGLATLAKGDKIKELLGSGEVEVTSEALTLDLGDFSGKVTGAGALIKETKDLLTLSGVNTYTGKTQVKAGTLTLSGSLVSNSVTVDSDAIANVTSSGLAADTSLTANGTVNISKNEIIKELLGSGSVDLDNSTLTLSEGSFSGNISGSKGNLTKVTKGLLALSGDNSFEGLTKIEAGTINLTGSLASSDINVSKDAFFTIGAEVIPDDDDKDLIAFSLPDNDQVIVKDTGLLSTATFTNDGTTTLNVDETVKSYTSSGILNGPGKLNAKTYTLNDGAEVNTKLGAGDLTVDGLVSLSDTSDSLKVTINDKSTLTLKSAQLLSLESVVNLLGTLTLAGGNQTIKELNGSGTLNLNTFEFITGGGNFSGTTNAKTTKIITDGGDLTLGGDTTTKETEINNKGSLTIGEDGSLKTGSTTITKGSQLKIEDGGKVGSDSIIVNGDLYVVDSKLLTYLKMNGAGKVFCDDFINAIDQIVAGNLVFSGNYINNKGGTTAAGNSPGTLTILGNYTENGILASEIETTTAGTGHDQIRVTGTVTLGATSILRMETFNGLVPTQGTRYQIISDAIGGVKTVSGAFGSVLFDLDGVSGSGAAVTNAAVIFDKATGRVTTTGLNSATSSFADFGSTTSQRNAAAALFGSATALVGQNQINSTTNEGELALQLISANAGSASNIARFTPEFYGALGDYALVSDLAVTNLLQSRVSTMASLPGKTPEGFSAFSGVRQQQASTADEADINRTDIYVGGDYTTVQNFTAGLIVTQNNGDFSSQFGSADADGMTSDAYVKSGITPTLDLVGRLGFGSYEYDLRRTTTDATQSIGSTDASTFAGSIGVSHHGWNKGEFNIAPRANLTYSSASVDGFTESGANDSLVLKSFDTTQLIAQVGASIVWNTTLASKQFSAELNLGLEQALVNEKDDQTATLVNSSTTSFNQVFADADTTRAAVGIRFGYDLTNNANIYLGYEGRVSSNSIGNVNTGIRISF